MSGTGTQAEQGDGGVVTAGRGRPAAGPRSGGPRLRGWLHAVVVPFTVAAVWLLWRSVDHLPLLERVPAAVYGFAAVLLFSVSAAYHVPTRWSPGTRARLVRLDGAATVLLIVGTFVPVAAYSLEGAWRSWSLLGALVVALVGGTVAVSSVSVPPHASAAAYAFAGWLTAIPMFRIAVVLPWRGVMLIVLGGVTYSIGALVFALGRPNPVPGWFGYHEVFHLLVTVAAALHFAAIWFHVLPLAT